MKPALSLLTALLLAPLPALHAADAPKQPLPKVSDQLQPVMLKSSELSGEIGRRIHDLIYKNYMVPDLEQKLVEPFRLRPPLSFDGAQRYVGTGKVIAAGSRFAAYSGDAEVGQRTTKLIAELIKSRDPDGYLGAMPAEAGGLQNYRAWTLHEQEYVILGLVENYRYCGETKSLQFARNLADYVIEAFSKCPTPDKVGTCGLAEAMLGLYGCTGEARYLEFAADTRHGGRMVDFDSLRHWRKTNIADHENAHKTNHVYANLARCYSQTLLYRWEPQDKLLDSSRFILNEITRKEGCFFVIGSTSNKERFCCSYSQDGSGKVAETCATAYLIRWLDSLMRLGGDLRYGDIMERGIYNALFAAQDPAGRRLRYFTPFEGKREWFLNDGYCCPGNYRRIVAALPEMVYYRTADGGIAVNLFTPSKKTIALDGGRSITIEQQTDYPTTGLVKLTITPSEPMEFPLRLRLPRWCPQATLTINGQAGEVSPGQPSGEIRRTWKAGETVTLEMPMPWRLVRGHGQQKGRVALMRGPVVYCIGTAANKALLNQFKEPRELMMKPTSGTKPLVYEDVGFEEPRELMIDPVSLGAPLPDTSVRPDGRKALAKAWPPGADAKGPATLDIVLTEFVDPSGVATYLRVPDHTKVGDDELLTQP